MQNGLVLQIKYSYSQMFDKSFESFFKAHNHIQAFIFVFPFNHSLWQQNRPSFEKANRNAVLKFM